MKVTIVPIVIGALGTITKGLLKGLKDLEVGGRVSSPSKKGEAVEEKSGPFPPGVDFRGGQFPFLRNFSVIDTNGET